MSNNLCSNHPAGQCSMYLSHTSTHSPNLAGMLLASGQSDAILESMKEKVTNRVQNQSGSQSDRERTLLYARGGVSTRWKMCRLTCPAHTPVEPRLLGPSPGSTERSHVSLHHSHPWYTGSCTAQSNQSPEAVLPLTASARGCPSSSPSASSSQDSQL